MKQDNDMGFNPNNLDKSILDTSLHCNKPENNNALQNMAMELVANTALTNEIGKRLDQISDILITNENSVIKSLADIKINLKEVQTKTDENTLKIDRFEIDRFQSDKQTRGFLVQAIITVLGCLFAFAIAQLFTSGTNISDVKVPVIEKPSIYHPAPQNIPIDDGILVDVGILEILVVTLIKM